MPVVAHQWHGSVAHEMVRVADKRLIFTQDVFRMRGRSERGSTHTSIKTVPCGIAVLIAALGVTGVDLDLCVHACEERTTLQKFVRGPQSITTVEFPTNDISFGRLLPTIAQSRQKSEHSSTINKGEQNDVAVFLGVLGLSAVRAVCLLFESTVCTVSTTTVPQYSSIYK